MYMAIPSHYWVFMAVGGGIPDVGRLPPGQPHDVPEKWAPTMGETSNPKAVVFGAILHQFAP